jgi:hypothetical protein
MNWKVSDVQTVQAHGRQATTYGFTILNEQGHPAFAFGYATQQEAEAAKAVIEPLVQSAVFLSDSSGEHHFSKP